MTNLEIALSIFCIIQFWWILIFFTDREEAKQLRDEYFKKYIQELERLK